MIIGRWSSPKSNELMNQRSMNIIISSSFFILEALSYDRNFNFNRITNIHQPLTLYFDIGYKVKKAMIKIILTLAVKHNILVREFVNSVVNNDTMTKLVSFQTVYL